MHFFQKRKNVVFFDKNFSALQKFFIFHRLKDFTLAVQYSVQNLNTGHRTK